MLAGGGFVLGRDPAAIDPNTLDAVIDPTAMPVGVDARVDALVRRLADARTTAA